MKLLAMGLCVLSLSVLGCATTAFFEDTMGRWVGASIHQFIKGYGYPRQKTKSQSGNTIYIYDLKSRDTCTIFLEVNNSDLIVDWRHEGDDCKMAPSIL